MTPLSDVLEEDVSDEYFASEHIQNRRAASHPRTKMPTIWHENKAGHISAYPYSCALRASASYNYLLVNGERRLTPREMFRLQGFPDDFRIVCNYSQSRKQAGNAVPPPLVRQSRAAFSQRYPDMDSSKVPRLRTVERYRAPYPLSQFPSDFAFNLAREIVYILATRSPRLEGSDWEEIFARVIGAEWMPSNVGLGDVLLGQCAWSAKTVKSSQPSKTKSIRLISGRNAPSYSYGVDNVKEQTPGELGEQVVEIWNERVSSVRQKHKHLRTVVLIKSDDLRELAVFEFDTMRFDASEYEWKWNKRGNLEGRDKRDRHKFTWQPHGSQFTIVEDVPVDRLALRINAPANIEMNRDGVLDSLGFTASWVQIID